MSIAEITSFFLPVTFGSTSMQYGYILAVLIIVASFVYHIFYVKSLPGEPPLIKGYLPFVGVAIPFLLGQERYMSSSRVKYGDIFTLYIAGLRVTVILDSIEGFPAVYRNKVKSLSFHKWERWVMTRIMGVEGEIYDKEGMMDDLWKTYSPLLSHGDMIKENTEAYARGLDFILKRDLAKWKRQGVDSDEGMVVDFKDWWSQIIFEAGGRALFGETFPQEEMFYRDYESWELGFSNLMMGFPKWFVRKSLQARERVQKRLSEFYKKGLVNASQFINGRVQVYLKHNFTAERAGYNMADMLMAMEGNPIPASMWYMLHVLRTSPQVFDEVISTINSHVKPAEESDPSPLSFNLYSILADPLLHGMFVEVLRLQATTLTVRAVTFTTVLPCNDRDYSIRQGSVLFAPASALHLDGDIYPDPLKFEPKRFMGDDLESSHIASVYEDDSARGLHVHPLPGKKDQRFRKQGVVVKHNLIPFGGGDHLCPGRRFAESEVVIGSAFVLRVFEITPLHGKEFETPGKGPRFGLGIDNPGNRIMARVKLREQFRS